MNEGNQQLFEKVSSETPLLLLLLLFLPPTTTLAKVRKS